MLMLLKQLIMHLGIVLQVATANGIGLIIISAQKIVCKVLDVDSKAVQQKLVGVKLVRGVVKSNVQFVVD